MEQLFRVPDYREQWPESGIEKRMDALEAKLDRLLDLAEGRLIEVPGLGLGRLL